MYSFKNDYSEGAHPKILNRLMTTNLEQAEGYSEDIYGEEAKRLIHNKLHSPHSNIHFFSGGTQTNLTLISALLRPHEAAISADTGHIAVHETGAIEATGHKVITRTVSDGKLTPNHIASAIDEHTDEHMVKPKLVYLSNPTEVGTIYSKGELEAIHAYCREHNLYLFVDGARLGSALCAEGNDLTLSDLARLTDAFYIGGTKNGALLGEALVMNNVVLQEDFRYMMKQKGALLAKGRILSIQFLELFTDDLYLQLAEHANRMADKIKEAITDLGYSFLVQSPTNQIFPILPNKVIKKLEEKYLFYVWAPHDDSQSSLRLVTSWATEEASVEAFLEDLRIASL